MSFILPRWELGRLRNEDNDQSSNKDNRPINDNIAKEEIFVARVQLLAYFLSGLISFLYPLLKIALIALASKVLQEAIKITFGDNDENNELLKEIEESIWNSSNNNSAISSIFLLKSYNFYETFIMTMGLILLIGICVTIRNSLQTHYLGFMEVKRLQRILYDKFLLEPNSVDMKQARDLLFTQIKTIQEFNSRPKYMLVEQSLLVGFGLLLFLILAWDIGLMLLGACFIIILVSKGTYQRLSTPWAEQREEKVAEANSRLLDLVVCKDVVLSHTMELEEQRVLYDNIDADRQEIRRTFVARFVAQCFQNLTFTSMMPMIFLYVYIQYANLNRFFQLLIVIAVMDEMMRSYLALLQELPMLDEYKRAKRAFVVVMGVDESKLFPFPWKICWRRNSAGKQAKCGIKEELEYDPTNSRYRTESQPLEVETIKAKLVNPAPNDKLTLKNVTLGYKIDDGSFKNVIENLNLSFEIGHSYALMGESGAGKSTILKALTGLLPIQKGQTSISDTPIDLMTTSWREQVAVVSQDSLLFNRKLRENLSYGLSEITDERILDALDKVNLKEIVCRLPEGLDTVLRFNGNEFSGGQKQRFQIARVLLTSGGDCPVVLLDEMTSALDAKSTRDIVRELKAFISEGRKTLIMITHDVETLTLADTIIEISRHNDHKDDTDDSMDIMISETPVEEWMKIRKVDVID